MGYKKLDIKSKPRKLQPRKEIGWYDILNSNGVKINNYPLTIEEANKLIKC